MLGEQAVEMIHKVIYATELEVLLRVLLRLSDCAHIGHNLAECRVDFSFHSFRLLLPAL